MIEHPLAVRDLARAEAPRVGAIEAGRMRFEPHAVERRVITARTQTAEREANDHATTVTGRRDRAGHAARRAREESMKSNRKTSMMAAIALWSVATLPVAAQPPTTPRAQQTLGRPDVVYVPTPQPVVDAMLKMANVGPSDVVYDLGCGDGRIPVTAAQRFGARGVGIDIDPVRIGEANENAKAAGVADKVTFLNQDLFTSDFSEATVVTLYLLPSLNEKLMPKLKALKPGTRIVSHAFDMGSSWPPEKTEQVEGKTIYFWTIK
jgi:SAM-dependent methyltransferase